MGDGKRGFKKAKEELVDAAYGTAAAHMMVRVRQLRIEAHAAEVRDAASLADRILSYFGLSRGGEPQPAATGRADGQDERRVPARPEMFVGNIPDNTTAQAFAAEMQQALGYTPAQITLHGTYAFVAVPEGRDLTAAVTAVSGRRFGDVQLRAERARGRRGHGAAPAGDNQPAAQPVGDAAGAAAAGL